MGASWVGAKRDGRTGVVSRKSAAGSNEQRSLGPILLSAQGSPGRIRSPQLRTTSQTTQPETLTLCRVIPERQCCCRIRLRQSPLCHRRGRPKTTSSHPKLLPIPSPAARGRGHPSPKRRRAHHRSLPTHRTNQNLGSSPSRPSRRTIWILSRRVVPHYSQRCPRMVRQRSRRSDSPQSAAAVAGPKPRAPRASRVRIGHATTRRRSQPRSLTQTLPSTT